VQKTVKYRFFRLTLFFSNLAFALLFTFSLLAAIIPPAVLPFFSIFGLLHPPLLIINLLFIVTWVLLKSKNALISLIVIILGFTTINNNFQFSFSGNEATDTTSIKLLTYNVQRFGLDEGAEETAIIKQNILQFISDENPGIVCLQEYHGKGRTLYEPLQEMKTDLHAGAYYYESYFSPRYQQLTGLVIFSQFEAVNKGKLKFEGSRTFGIYTDLIINRDTIRVYNIHLASIQLMPSDIDFVVNPAQEGQETFATRATKIYSKLSEAFDLRERQMDHLLSQISACPYPILLAGDFNDTPSSFIYSRISKVLDDTFTEKGRGFSITYAGQIPFLRIDYIMKSALFNTVAYKRHNLNFSDHFPVSATLTRF